MDSKEIKNIVKKGYAQAVNKQKGCCSKTLDEFVKDSEKISQSIGYSEADLKGLSDANLGLGCGNPVASLKVKALKQ